MSSHKKKKTLTASDQLLEANTRDPYECIRSRTICSWDHHIKKKNCIDNPWCLFGLGENKKAGAWDDPPQCISMLGIDPSLKLRRTVNDKLSPPVGLKNLGATCYLNVLVQTLFHNLLIRDAIHNMNSFLDPKHNSEKNTMITVVESLQSIFASMELGRKGTCNLEILTSLLGL